MPINVGNNELNSVGANVLAYSNVVTDGLVFYADAGIASSYPGSSTAVYDLSGNGSTGTLYNGVGYTTSNGGALTFDGVDDYGTFPANSANNLTGSMTAAVWVYYISGNGRIYQKDDWGGSTYTRCWEIGGYGGTFRMEMWHQNGSGTIGYGNALTVNGWSYLALTFDQTDIKMYQNTSLITTVNFPGDLRQDINTPITIGGRWSSGEWLNGRIGNVLLYNRALTASEVLQNFNANRRRFNI